MTRKPTTPETPTTDETTELLAALAAAEAKASALTKPSRTKGPRKLRTFYDTALLLKLAADLGPDANWIDLGNAYRAADGPNSADWSDADSFHGPKLRTRLSQLANRDSNPLPENFRPIAPADQPLYFANREADAIRAKLAALGIDTSAADAITDASNDADDAEATA